MKREYDFSNGEREKFYRPNARMVLPIYLNGTLHKQLEPIALAQGKDVGDVVNQIVKNQIQLMALLGKQKRPNPTLQPPSRDGNKSKSKKNPRTACG